MENLSQDNFTTEKVNVISNCLLGNYINKQYVIADDIKDELISVKKLKKSVFKNSVFCSAYIVGYGDVVFEVTFQKNTVKSVAMAELFVLENEYKINGYIQNTIRTKVGQYIDDLDNFIEKTYDYFNIELTEHKVSYDKKEEEETNAYINAKRNFSINMAKLTKKDYNKLYRNYVTARLELLKKTNNDYSNTVLDKFNGEFSKIEKFFLQDNNYKALSELLDKCIEDVNGVNPKFAQEEKQVVEKLTPIINDFSKQADDIFEKAQPKAMNSLDREDKTRMEDIEREMYEHQQNKKATKEEQTKLQEFYDRGESTTSETKEEKVQTPKTQPERKSEQAPTKQPQSTPNPNTSTNTASTLNEQITTPNYKVDIERTAMQNPVQEEQKPAPVSQQPKLVVVEQPRQMFQSQPIVTEKPAEVTPRQNVESQQPTEININVNIIDNEKSPVPTEELNNNNINNVEKPELTNKENIKGVQPHILQPKINEEAGMNKDKLNKQVENVQWMNF